MPGKGGWNLKESIFKTLNAQGVAHREMLKIQIDGRSHV